MLLSEQTDTERHRKMKDIPNKVSSRTRISLQILYFWGEWSILFKYGFDRCWFGYFYRGVFKSINMKYWGLVTTMLNHVNFCDNYLLEKRKEIHKRTEPCIIIRPHWISSTFYHMHFIGVLQCIILKCGVILNGSKLQIINTNKLQIKYK